MLKKLSDKELYDALENISCQITNVRNCVISTDFQYMIKTLEELSDKVRSLKYDTETGKNETKECEKLLEDIKSGAWLKKINDEHIVDNKIEITPEMLKIEEDMEIYDNLHKYTHHELNKDKLMMDLFNKCINDKHFRLRTLLGGSNYGWMIIFDKTSYSDESSFCGFIQTALKTLRSITKTNDWHINQTLNNIIYNNSHSGLSKEMLAKISETLNGFKNNVKFEMYHLRTNNLWSISHEPDLELVSKYDPVEWNKKDLELRNNIKNRKETFTLANQFLNDHEHNINKVMCRMRAYCAVKKLTNVILTHSDCTTLFKQLLQNKTILAFHKNGKIETNDFAIYMHEQYNIKFVNNLSKNFMETIAIDEIKKLECNVYYEIYNKFGIYFVTYDDTIDILGYDTIDILGDDTNSISLF